MHDTYFLYSGAARVVEDRLVEAEKLRQVRRAHAQSKAWARLRRAVELGRREGLDGEELAHELFTSLGEKARN
jgi:hypothetical protein